MRRSSEICIHSRFSVQFPGFQDELQDLGSGSLSNFQVGRMICRFWVRFSVQFLGRKCNESICGLEPVTGHNQFLKTFFRAISVL
jgi:hypothetical protein